MSIQSLSILYPGKRSNSARKSVTFRRREGGSLRNMPPFLPTIPRLEPRASSPTAQHGQSHHGRTAPGMYGRRCTQGCIPGWCIPGCISLYIPGWCIPPCIYASLYTVGRYRHHCPAPLSGSTGRCWCRERGLMSVMGLPWKEGGRVIPVIPSSLPPKKGRPWA